MKTTGTDAIYTPGIVYDLRNTLLLVTLTWYTHPIGLPGLHRDGGVWFGTEK